MKQQMLKQLLALHLLREHVAAEAEPAATPAEAASLTISFGEVPRPAPRNPFISERWRGERKGWAYR